MSVRPKTGSRSFATRTVLGLAVLCLACPSASRAQCVSAPANSVTLQDQGTVSIYPFVWAPGHSYTVTITGTYPTGFGAPTYCLGLSAWQWPDYPDYYQVGGYDSNIQISNPTWVSPTVTTFDVSVNSNAPTGKDFLELQVPGGEDFWGILIQPPPAPTQPSPPPPAPCATPALDPTNPVTPDTWIPGKTYNITVKGTGFTTQAASSLPNCPATTITVSVPTGSVALSNIVVVDSSTITAAVTPAGTDPGETANITLWGPPEFDDDDDDQSAGTAAAPAAVLLQDEPSTTLFVPNVLPQSSAWQFPAAFNSLIQLPAPQTAALMAALAQPAMPRAVLAAAGAQTNGIPADPSGMANDGQATAQIVRPTISLERIDLMDIEAKGAPTGGTFDEPVGQAVIGTTIAMVAFESGFGPNSNPTLFQLGDPDNPCTKAVPCPGGLEDITATYTVQGALPGQSGAATKNFYVPTFGMSCYYTTPESDWGSPPNNCNVPLKWKGKIYVGPVTDPGSLSGTYCLAFIEDVIVNVGSGVLNNGVAVQKVNGSIGQTPDGKIHTADGPVPVVNQTVARDRNIIPAKGVSIDLDQVGSGVAADDIGGDIVGYRLDLYKGLGKVVCANNNNVIVVGACTPAQSLCPASAIQ